MPSKLGKPLGSTNVCTVQLGKVSVYLVFSNLPNGLETVKIKALSLIIFVGLVWQTMFAGDDVSVSEFCVCYNTNLLRYVY